MKPFSSDKDQTSLNLDLALKDYQASRKFTKPELGTFLAFLAASNLAEVSYKMSEFDELVKAMRQYFIQMSEEMDT